MAVVSGVRLPELPAESFTLAGGLRVRLIPLPHLQSATVSFFLRVGSRYETTQTNGLSHFLEHMLFLGTERYPEPGDYKDYLAESDGFSNARPTGSGPSPAPSARG